MADVGMVAIVVVFYGICAAYVTLCDKVIGTARATADQDHPSPTDHERIEVDA